MLLQSTSLNTLPPELLLKIIYYLYYGKSHYKTQARTPATHYEHEIHIQQGRQEAYCITALSLVNKNMRRICFPFVFRHILCEGDVKLRHLAHELSLKDEWAVGLARCICRLDVFLPSTLCVRGDEVACGPVSQNTNRSLYIGLKACSSLTSLRLHNILLSNTLIGALSQSTSLRLLEVSLDPSFYAPLSSADLPLLSLPLTKASCSSLPPIETLKLSPPLKSHRVLIYLLQSSLRSLSLSAPRTRRSQAQDVLFGSSLDIPVLSIPHLAHLQLRGILFSPGPLRRFVSRHCKTLTELNVECAVRLNLSWVIRIVKTLSRPVPSRVDETQDTKDETGLEEKDEDGEWGRFDIDAFGCVLHGRKSDNWGLSPASSDASTACYRRDVTQLGLSFPLATTLIDPLDDISHLSSMFADECWRKLEVLKLAGDPYFAGYFSEFVTNLRTLCVYSLSKLRTISVAWNTHGYPWQPSQMRFDPPTADHDLNSGSLSVNLGTWDSANIGQAFVLYLTSTLLSSAPSSPDLNGSPRLYPESSGRSTLFPTIALPALPETASVVFPSSPSSNPTVLLAQEEWDLFEKKRYAHASQLMSDLMRGSPSLEVVRFCFGRSCREKEREWVWKRVRPESSKTEMVGNECYREKEIVIGDLLVTEDDEEDRRRRAIMVSRDVEWN